MFNYWFITQCRFLDGRCPNKNTLDIHLLCWDRIGGYNGYKVWLDWEGESR
jgi:hypothetical protein